MIHVSYFANIRELSGMKDEDRARVGTVLELMSFLCDAHGAKFRDFCMDGGNEISRNVNILVNGKHIRHLNEGQTILEDGDEVSIFPLIGGG
jgi:MoaD family protein